MLLMTNTTKTTKLETLRRELATTQSMNRAATLAQMILELEQPGNLTAIRARRTGRSNVRSYR
jgi:hypothetical protein